jgi:hypothetical protein
MVRDGRLPGEGMTVITLLQCEGVVTQGTGQQEQANCDFLQPMVRPFASLD